MLNCKQVSRLLSDALERRLEAEEQDRVDRHLAICPACENCRRHFLALKAWREAVCAANDSPSPS